MSRKRSFSLVARETISSGWSMEKRKEKKKKKDARALLFVAARASSVGKMSTRLFLLERPHRDGTATFIIKSRLLAFTRPRNGEIQDLRRYTIAHRPVCGVLTFKLPLLARELLAPWKRMREKERDIVYVHTTWHLPVSYSKLWRCAALCYYEWKPRRRPRPTVLLNRRIMETARGLMIAIGRHINRLLYPR